MRNRNFNYTVEIYDFRVFFDEDLGRDSRVIPGCNQKRTFGTLDGAVKASCERTLFGSAATHYTHRPIVRGIGRKVHLNQRLIRKLSGSFFLVFRTLTPSASCRSDLPNRSSILSQLVLSCRCYVSISFSIFFLFAISDLRFPT